MDHKNSLRVMTYNIGGGRKDPGWREIDGSGLKEEVMEIIQKWSPDVLGIQECVEWTDANNCKHSFGEQITEGLGYHPNYYFGKTLSLKENLHIRKEVMLLGLYHDWVDWAQGNAISMRYGFTRLGEPQVPGDPRNVPLYRPAVYEGTRDTDPRNAILARVDFPDVFPFVVCTHLTTLVGERGGETREIRGKSSEAQILRYQQTKNLLELLKPKIEENQAIILMGDFNAGPQEAAISSVLEAEGGFIRLTPKNDVSTHPKTTEAVDHIFVYPGDTIDVGASSCWIDDSDVSWNASDHLPVIADIVFK